MELNLMDPAAPVGEQAALIDRACRESGFFRVPLASIPAQVADRAWATALGFFARPEDEKRRIAFPEPGYPYGYSPYRHETLARSLHNDADTDADAEADLKESLAVGPDCGGQLLSEDAAWVRSPSIWPEHPSELRAAWVRYYQALTDLAGHLLEVMAVALDLSPEFFHPLIDGHISSMRAIHYPQLDHDPGGALRASAHSDYGTLTILRSDEVPGLEIQHLDGSWQPVAPQPDTFVVNLGDSIARWTNDRWRSTVHRVTARERTARYSFAYFHMANFHATIECLPSCVEPGRQPRYEPVRAGPWLMRKFQATQPEPSP